MTYSGNLLKLIVLTCFLVKSNFIIRFYSFKFNFIFSDAGFGLTGDTGDTGDTGNTGDTGDFMLICVILE